MSRLKRVLVLEDNPETRTMLQHAVHALPVRMVTAETGEEAVAFYNVARLENDPFDLLVLDVATPRKTGRTVLEEIRAKGDKTPAIFFTALEPVDVEADAVRLGAKVAYKPEAAAYIVEMIMEGT